MAKATGTQQYVLLPAQGLRPQRGTATPGAQSLLQSAQAAPEPQELAVGDRSVRVKVVDSIGPDGAKLVELAPDGVLAIRAAEPGLRVVPVVYYTPAVAPRRSVGARPEGVGPRAGKVTVSVISQGDGKPVAGAFVVAFTNFAGGAGAQGVTDAKGKVALALGASSVKLDRLYVYPLEGCWSLMKKGVTVGQGTEVALKPLDLGYTDGVRHFYGHPEDTAGAGVTVAVVDTGVAAHPDLVVAGGANTVPGEDPNDFGDNGEHHGTHVAGIVAARGHPPSGIRGVAPGVTLRAYRVFGKGSGQASSFAIAKGIDQAVTDKCDLVNLSLGGGMPDPTLKAAVDSARTRGSVCIIAAGNGDRAPVSFPASDAMALAVAAMGRKGTFPTGVAEVDDVAAPYGRDKADFVASFSNIGPEVDLLGPGVAIISTVPGGYAEISGTSMACPAVTGAAARVLATSPVLKKKRDANRANDMVKAVLASAKSLGFEPPFEGHGMPLPA